jgi:serine/threonine-protein kinase
MGDLLLAITSQPAPSLASLRPDLPADLAEQVAQLLAKRPQDRPADGTAVARSLRDIGTALRAALVSPGATGPSGAGTMVVPPTATPS